ncbi:MAG: hypothetical protein WC554_04305 [Clostridia bacterium]
MTDTDRKWLTKLIGECWHPSWTHEEGISICDRCNLKMKPLDIQAGKSRRTFTTWVDFGVLWEAMDKKGLLTKFLEEHGDCWLGEGVGNCCWDTRQVIDPIRFPLLILQFRDERKELFKEEI